jgi:predicted ester cyclase
MNTKTPAEIARETIETLFATHDLSVLNPHPGMESLRKVFPAFVKGLPDIKIELQQQIVAGNQVASHWLFRATHLGDLYGIPPTGKEVKFQNLNIMKIDDGKIVQYNSEVGWLALFMQIGFLPLKNDSPIH